MPQLRLALAQINPTVGDIEHNLDLIVSRCAEATAAGAHVFATGEMAIVGYPIEDLSHRKAFIDASRASVPALAQRLHEAGLGAESLMPSSWGCCAGQPAELWGVRRVPPLPARKPITAGARQRHPDRTGDL